MWGAWGSLYDSQDVPFCPRDAHHWYGSCQRSDPAWLQSTAETAGLTCKDPFTQLHLGRGRVQVPEVFSKHGTRAHATVRSSLGAVQLGTWLRRWRCFTLREETASGLRLPRRSQNRRRHSFGEKGHILVLDLVLEGEAPTPLGGRRWRPPQNPQLCNRRE